MIYFYKKYLFKFSKRTFQILIAFLLLYLPYFFYQPDVTYFHITVTNPIYEYVEGTVVWLYLVLYFICISFINVVIFISLSLYFNFHREFAEKQIRKNEKLFSRKIIDYLLSDTYENENLYNEFKIKLKKQLKGSIEIESLFSSYTKIQETIAFDLSIKFKKLLTDLELHYMLKVFLNSHDLSERILAMKMLSYLRINEYEDKILLYSQSKNYALRTEAFAAIVRLMDKEDHITNIIGEKHKLSMLDINVIVNAVLKNFKMNINYNALLASEHDSKVIIGLILAKYRYRKEYSNVIPILNHIGSKNLLKNELAWDSFLFLVPNKEAVDIIINRFKEEPYDIKLLILQKSHAIENPQYFEFLNQVIIQETLLLKIEALKILFNSNFKLILPFKNSKDPEIVQAYNEIIDF